MNPQPKEWKIVKGIIQNSRINRKRREVAAIISRNKYFQTPLIKGTTGIELVDIRKSSEEIIKKFNL